MGLIDQAKKDAETITMNSGAEGWGVEQKWKAPTGEEVTVVGLHVKHHTSIDADGNIVNTKNASITFSEKAMLDASYPIRSSSSGEVNMDKHKVTIKDSTGNEYKYRVKQGSWFPDETIGLITCILTAYE